jgi:hypothetical protein
VPVRDKHQPVEEEVDTPLIVEDGLDREPGRLAEEGEGKVLPDGEQRGLVMLEVKRRPMIMKLVMSASYCLENGLLECSLVGVVPLKNRQRWGHMFSHHSFFLIQFLYSR